MKRYRSALMLLWKIRFDSELSFQSNGIHKLPTRQFDVKMILRIIDITKIGINYGTENDDEKNGMEFLRKETSVSRMVRVNFAYTVNVGCNDQLNVYVWFQ